MHKTLLALSVALLSLPSFSADLLQAWQAAQQYDATMLASRYAQQAGLEKANQAHALLLPKVTLAGNSGYLVNDYQAGSNLLQDSNSNGNNYGYSISAQQPIFRAEVFASSDQLKKQADLATVQYQLAEQELILRVAKAYFELLAADEKVQLAKAQKQAIAEQLALAKKSFEVGVATITDTDEAQASYDSILAEEIVANNDLVVKKNALSLLTGLDSENIAKLTDAMAPTLPVPNDLSVWLKKSSNTSLSIDRQLLTLDIAKREIDKYRLLNSPSLDLVASYGQAWDSGCISRSGNTDQTGKGMIGLQLSIPLFTGGERTSKLNEAAAKEAQQRQIVEATRRETEQLTKQAFLGVNAGAAQINALQQVLKSSQSLLASSKLGREVGVRTTVDVLNAEQKYYQTRYDLTVARYSYLYTKLQLAAVVGDLNEMDVKAVNEWLINK